MLCCVCFANEMKMRVKATDDECHQRERVGKQKMPNSKSKIRKRESTQKRLEMQNGCFAKGGGCGRSRSGREGGGAQTGQRVGKTFCCLSLIKQPRDVPRAAGKRARSTGGLSEGGGGRSARGLAV